LEMKIKYTVTFLNRIISSMRFEKLISKYNSTELDVHQRVR
jgi:hypothetical protein